MSIYRARDFSASVSGRSLASRIPHKKAAARAVTAARIVEGKTSLVDLTAKSVAALCGVSVPYLNAAMRLSEEERMAVLAGRRPLIAPKQPKPAQQAAEARAQVDAAMARLNEALQLIADVGADHAAALAAEEQKADA
jgi:hypothetical protein